VAKPKIVSREYKLLLRATLFQGNDARLTRSAKGFWRDFGQAIGTVARDIEGRLAVQERRLIRFYDTADHSLRRNDYDSRRSSSSGLSAGLIVGPQRRRLAVEPGEHGHGAVNRAAKACRSLW
jgi:hypothetical protein